MMEEKAEDQMNLSHVSSSQREPNLSFPKVDLRKPPETMKEVIQIERTPWVFQFRPKKGTCVEHEEEEEGRVSIPHSLPPPSPMVISDNPWKSGSCKRKRPKIPDFYGQSEVQSSAMEQAKEVQANMAAKFPSFVKPMIRSNVTGGFWLSLPKIFCNLHLPRRETIVILVDESGEEYKVKYLAERRGLSGGWKRFSIAHQLVEGDVLVFHLVRNCKFKVYIVRANGSEEVDAALGLLHLDANAKRMNPDHVQKDIRNLKQSRRKQSLPRKSLKESFQKDSQMVVNANQPKSDSEGLGLVLEGLISETTSIANAIRACKLTTSLDDFAIWDKNLITFEQLRVNVGFIHARLDCLVCLVVESKEAVEYKRFRESVFQQDRGKELCTIEVRLFELKEAIERLHAEIEALKINAEMHKLMLKRLMLDDEIIQ